MRLPVPCHYWAPNIACPSRLSSWLPMWEKVGVQVPKKRLFLLCDGVGQEDRVIPPALESHGESCDLGFECQRHLSLAVSASRVGSLSNLCRNPFLYTLLISVIIYNVWSFILLLNGFLFVFLFITHLLHQNRSSRQRFYFAVCTWCLVK